jgi:ABC-type branched-subunit amino acid transport system ATPase component/predicted MFS family arabinose efflux permease
VSARAGVAAAPRWPTEARRALEALRARLDALTGTAALFPLAVLFLLYFFDQFDTAAFGVLAPDIESAFHLSDHSFGLIVVANLSIVLLLAIPVGHLGDRLPRRQLVVLGGILAGVFSFLTGVAGTLLWFVLVRVGNGVGQLVNDPIHNSLLSDYYPPSQRPRVFAAHQDAVYLGAVVGPAAAGVVAALAGWRAAFMVLIVPIVVTALVALRLSEPRRGQSDDPEAAAAAETERPVAFGRSARMLFSVRTLRRQYAAWLFVGAGYIPLAFIVPLYLQRVYGLGALPRGVVGSANAAVAFAGLLLAGRLTQRRWLPSGLGVPLRYAGAILATVGVGIVLVAVAPVLGLAILLGLATNFVGGMFFAPFYTVQALVSPARVRSLSFAFGSLFLIVGVWVLWVFPGVSSVSDSDGIRVGLAVLAPYWLIGGALLASAERFVEADAKQAFAVLATVAELRRARDAASERALLVVRDLEVSYGQVQVLFGVSLEVAPGEVVALVGTNGAGKSTLLRAICGQVPAHRGGVFFDGEDLSGLEPEDRFRRGIVQVPGGRGVFPGLTVRENLEVAVFAAGRPRRESARVIDEVTAPFPALRRRIDQPAAVLSGGEQQMLTLAQAFVARPRLLLVDELSLGLAPVIVEELLESLVRLRDAGAAIVLVEQSVNVALTVAHRACFMEKGEIRFEGPTAELLERPDILRSVFLGGLATGGGLAAGAGARLPAPARGGAR